MSRGIPGGWFASCRVGTDRSRHLGFNLKAVWAMIEAIAYEIVNQTLKIMST